MDILIAATICFAIIGVGELVSYITKAFIPSMAASLIVYLLLTWFGMPKDFPDVAGFNYLGELSMLFLVAHLGTAVVPIEYIRNIKSVVVAAAALVGGLIMVVGVGGIFFGWQVMLGGAGAACGGGAIAGILAIQKLTDIGALSLVAVPAIVMGTVDFFGQPVAAFLLKKYTAKLSKKDAYLLEKMAHKDDEKNEIRLTSKGIPYCSEENPSSRIATWVPKALEEDGFVLMELAIMSLLAYWLESVTGISMYIFVFFIGVFGCELGILRMNLLDRSHSYGFVICVFLAWIFVAMNDITPAGLLAALGPSVACLVLGAIGLAGAGGLVGKLLGYDFWLSAACGMGLMFLMPGVMIVTKEVCARNSRDAEEERFFLDKTEPNMYIAANAGYIMGVAITVSCLLNLLG